MLPRRRRGGRSRVGLGDGTSASLSALGSRDSGDGDDDVAASSLGASRRQRNAAVRAARPAKPARPLSFGGDDDDDDDDDDENDGGGAAARRVQAQLAAAKRRSRHTAVSLSQLTASSQADHAPQQSAAGEYSAERLAQLAQSTFAFNAVAQRQVSFADDAPMPQQQTAGVEINVDDGDDGDAEHVPDAAAIAAAKLRRRQRLQDQDYISLDPGDNQAPPSVPALEAKRRSSSDALLAFGDPSVRAASQHRAEMAKAAGVAVRVLPVSQKQTPSASQRSLAAAGVRAALAAAQQGSSDEEDGDDDGDDGDGDAPAARVNMLAEDAPGFDQDVDALTAELTSALAAMTSLLSEHKQQHAEAAERVQRSGNAVQQAELAVLDTQRELGYFRDLAEFIADLQDLWETKSADVTALEQRVSDALVQTAQRLQQVRAAHVRDEIDAVLGRVPSDNAAGGGGVDDMGRDLGMMAARERAVRQRIRDERRQQRHAAVSDQPDGALSSDDRGADVQHAQDELQRCLRQVSQDAAGVLDDASDEFASLVAVHKRLYAWQRTYPRRWRDAYAAASVAAVLTPYVRLDMLTWQPLDPGATDLPDTTWYKLCAADANQDVLRDILTGVVRPRLLHALQHVYDPLSLAQTHTAQDLLQHWLPRWPALAEALVQRVRACLTDDPALCLDALHTSAGPWRLLRFLRHVVLWYDTAVLPEAARTHLSDTLALVLDTRVLPFLHRSAAQTTAATATWVRRVVEEIPPHARGRVGAGLVNVVRRLRLQQVEYEVAYQLLSVEPS